MRFAVRAGEVSAEDAALMQQLRSAIGGAEPLAALPAVLASVLGERLALVRVSVRAHLAGTDNVEILAVWSAEPTKLVAGLRMPTRAMSFDAVVKGGRKVVVHDVRPADGMMHDILFAEGVRSYVSLPLVVDDVPVAALSMSSGTPKGFDGVDQNLLAAIAGTVSERYAALSPR